MKETKIRSSLNDNGGNLFRSANNPSNSPFLGPHNWLLYSGAVDSSPPAVVWDAAKDLIHTDSPPCTQQGLRQSWGEGGKRAFVCAADLWSVLCLFAGTHREALKGHRFVASIGFPPPFIWVWINGANWGFDRTNSHLLMSHTGHRMLLMLQLRRNPRCEVCKHLALLFRSQLSGELYSISTLKLYVSDLNCKLWLNVISSLHFFSYSLLVLFGGVFIAFITL